MVDSQIVEEEKDLLVRGLEQSLEKLEQWLCIHGATVNHKTHVALVGHRRDHIPRGPFRGQPNHRGLPSGRIAAAMFGCHCACPFHRPNESQPVPAWLGRQ